MSYSSDFQNSQSMFLYRNFANLKINSFSTTCAMLQWHAQLDSHIKCHVEWLNVTANLKPLKCWLITTRLGFLMNCWSKSLYTSITFTLSPFLAPLLTLCSANITFAYHDGPIEAHEKKLFSLRKIELAASLSSPPFSYAPLPRIILTTTVLPFWETKIDHACPRQIIASPS